MPTHPLFHHFIDYAGVFPPASHSLTEAGRRFVAAKADPRGWILGPFLLRASQLSELDAEVGPVGLVVDVDPSDVDLSIVDPVQVERRVDHAGGGDLTPLLSLAPVVYVESTDPTDFAVMQSITEARDTGFDVRAKIRTGGATSTTFPTPSVVATFIRTCVALGVPFKATAGLHHPFRHDSEIAGATEHGFVNLIAAVRAAVAGGQSRLEEILLETSADAFDVVACTWKGVGAEVSASSIRTVFSSIGSCSFDEPAGYLQALGALDVPA